MLSLMDDTKSLETLRVWCGALLGLCALLWNSRPGRHPRGTHEDDPWWTDDDEDDAGSE